MVEPRRVQPRAREAHVVPHRQVRGGNSRPRHHRTKLPVRADADGRLLRNRRRELEPGAPQLVGPREPDLKERRASHQSWLLVGVDFDVTRGEGAFLGHCRGADPTRVQAGHANLLNRRARESDPTRYVGRTVPRQPRKPARSGQHVRRRVRRRPVTEHAPHAALGESLHRVRNEEVHAVRGDGDVPVDPLAWDTEHRRGAPLDHPQLGRDATLLPHVARPRGDPGHERAPAAVGHSWILAEAVERVGAQLDGRCVHPAQIPPQPPHERPARNRAPRRSDKMVVASEAHGEIGVRVT